MISISRLNATDVAVMAEANRLFSCVFGDEGYQGPPPGDDHLRRLLADDKFIALVARIDGEMVGALAGYELVKFEAERSEILEAHRRLITMVHPDRGGTNAQVHEANAARDLLIEELPNAD